MRLDMVDAFGRRRLAAHGLEDTVLEHPPITAAVCATRLVASGSRSMRALSTPASVSGIFASRMSRVARQCSPSRTT
jgi:hypothetical protein